MDVNKLNTGEKIAGASAILLFIFMFFNWFGVEISGEGGTVSFGSGAGGNAWDALDFIPIILVIAIVVALVNVFLRLSDSDYEPPVSMNVAVTVLGGISVLLVLFRIIDPPGFGTFGGVTVDATLEFGIFLGLIAAAGIAYGGYRGMQEEGTTFSGTADKLSGGGTGGNPPPPPSSTPPPPPPPPPAQ
jgi:amino acid transporter